MRRKREKMIEEKIISRMKTRQTDTRLIINFPFQQIGILLAVIYPAKPNNKISTKFDINMKTKLYQTGIETNTKCLREKRNNIRE